MKASVKDPVRSDDLAGDNRHRLHEWETERPSLLGLEQRTVLLTPAGGIPVHAVLAAGRNDGARVVLDLLRTVPGRSVLVTFANPSTPLLARRSAAFDKDLLSFDLVLPDGIGMCMALRVLYGLPGRRVSFDMTSLAPAVFEHASLEQLSVVLVGGAEGIAERARERLQQHYPDLQITAAFDGFNDPAKTMREIIGLQPDILVCGMGGATQEAFLLRARNQGWGGWGFTCGGFLDQLVEGLHYYPMWIDRLNLRWAYRMFREPRRLWRRYLLDYSRFGLMVCADRARRG